MFVVDISGSMGAQGISYTHPISGQTMIGSRLDRAKSEMIRTIMALPTYWKFNMTKYECTVGAFRPTTVEATDGNKLLARDWIMLLRPMGGTNTSDGCIRGLECDRENELLVLLTDGAPNCNCPWNYPNGGDPWLNCVLWHQARIISANTQGAVINTFGIGVYGGYYEQFLMNLAMQTGGTYTSISM